MNIKKLNEKLEKFLLKEDLYAIADPEDEDSWKSMGSGDQQGPIFGSKSAASKYKKEHGLKGKIYDVDFDFLDVFQMDGDCQMVSHSHHSPSV